MDSMADGVVCLDLEVLFDASYDELRRVAGRCFARERQGITLQPTALVHEAYLRLSRADATWPDRVTFLAYAARVMRQVMVDEARRRGAEKRGGDAARITWVDDLGAQAAPSLDVLALHESLSRLEALDPRKAQVVLLRFFSALTLDEVAAVLDVSLATVNREWRGARAWLSRELGA